MNPEAPTPIRFPSRREYAAKQAAVRARVDRILGAMIVSGITMLLGLAIFVSPGIKNIQIEPNPAWGFLGMVGVVAALFGGIILLDRAVQKWSSKCPACQKTLAYNSRGGRQVLLTGRCSHCAACVFDGEEELEDPAVENNKVTLLSSAQLKVDFRRAQKVMLKWLGVSVVSMFVGALFSAFFAGWIVQGFGEIWSPIARVLFMILLVAPGLIAFVRAICVGPRRSGGDARCPHCSDKIGIAAVTGYCGKCGQRAVLDPWPGLAAASHASEQPAWSIEEYRNLAQPLSQQIANMLKIAVVVGKGTFLVTMPALILLEVFSPDGNVRGGIGNTLVVLGLIVLPLIALGSAMSWAWFLARRVHCPHCRRELVSSYWLVISTRRCVHCGEVVLDRATAVARP